MRSVYRVNHVALVMALVVLCSGAVSSALAQDPVEKKTRQRVVNSASQDPPTADNAKSGEQKQGSATLPADGISSSEGSRVGSDIPPETQANRQQQGSEEAAVVPYYNNFFSTYHLGPEDVISVIVFGQERYSRSGIIIPPSGRVNLALIPNGIFVNGKTVDEVAELIRKRYDEYIIDPQVTVSLEKASSYRYSIIGDIAQPGVRLMARRMTITEAIAEAGGVLQTGDKSRVVVLRRQANGMLGPMPVNVAKIYRGQQPDTYLVPGDQIVVPGNKVKSIQRLLSFVPIVSTFARILTGGLPY